MVKKSLFISYLSSLLDGDKTTCCEIVKQLLDEGISLKDLYVNLFQKSMSGIGRKWNKNEISISTEHIASQITGHLMSYAFESYPKAQQVNKTVLLFCIDKELHELGIKMVSDIFEINGWRSYYLGTNNSTRCILTAIKEKRPDVIGISFNFYMNISKLIETVGLIEKEFTSLKIIIGGQAIGYENYKIKELLPHLTYIKNLDDAEKFIIEWQ